MSHRVDAPVHAVQAPRGCACPDCFFAEAKPSQLVYRDHAVLSLRDAGDRTVGCGDFPGHYKG
jgi:hypothetical protein